MLKKKKKKIEKYGRKIQILINVGHNKASVGKRSKKIINIQIHLIQTLGPRVRTCFVGFYVTVKKNRVMAE